MHNWLDFTAKTLSFDITNNKHLFGNNNEKKIEYLITVRKTRLLN